MDPGAAGKGAASCASMRKHHSGRVASLGDDQAGLGEKGNRVVTWAVGVRDLPVGTRGRWFGV